MKILNKSAFFTGLFLIFLEILSFIGVFEHSTAFRTVFRIVLAAMAVYNFYLSFSASGNKRAEKQKKHYRQASRLLHGRLYSIKANLPIIITVFFICVLLVFRLSTDRFIPDWLIAIYIIALPFAAAYSIGINRATAKYIEALEEAEKQQ